MGQLDHSFRTIDSRHDSRIVTVPAGFGTA